MSFSRRILTLVIGISFVAVTSEIVSQQPQKHTDWSVSIAKTKMKTMTAEQQAAHVSSLQQEQATTFCEKFPCAPGCGRTFCECFPGAPWCSDAASVHSFPISAQAKTVLNEQAWACIRPDLHR